MNKLEKLKQIRYETTQNAKEEVDRRVAAANQAVTAEEERLLAAFKADKMKDIPGSYWSFAWTASWEVLFEGDVYQVTEIDAAGPECLSFSYMRKATREDIQSAKIGKPVIKKVK